MPSAGRARRFAGPAARLIVSTALCVFIATKVDWGEVSATLRTVDLLYLAAGFLVLLPSPTTSAVKWRQLLTMHGIRLSFRHLHQTYWIALFLNNFLPSSIGGDAYRLYRTLDNGVTRAGAVSAILVERIVGLAALLALGYAAAIVLELRSPDPLLEKLLFAGFGCAVAGMLGLLVILSPVGRRIMQHRLFPKKVTTLLSKLGDYRRNPAAFARFLGVTALFHLCQFTSFWLTLRAFGLPIDPLKVVVIVMATSTIGILPITINGLGLIDGTFVFLATHFGATSEAALSTMLMIRAFVVVSCIPGACLYLKQGLGSKSLPRENADSAECAGANSAPPMPRSP